MQSGITTQYLSAFTGAIQDYLLVCGAAFVVF
jgi:hypothetical protein